MRALSSAQRTDLLQNQALEYFFPSVVFYHCYQVRRDTWLNEKSRYKTRSTNAAFTSDPSMVGVCLGGGGVRARVCVHVRSVNSPRCLREYSWSERGKYPEEQLIKMKYYLTPSKSSNFFPKEPSLVSFNPRYASMHFNSSLCENVFAIFEQPEMELA